MERGGLGPTTIEPASEVVDLAREADFRLGGLMVSPSTGRVLAAGRERRIQPRVMEVVVMLVRRAGRTVSRDDLIDACWSGRIVSDNAVNRVLTQVRALAQLTDPPAFVVETVPKVGVRLIPSEPASPPDLPAGAGAAGAGPPLRRPARRLAIAAGVAAAFAVGAVAVGLSGRVSVSASAGGNGRIEVAAFAPLSSDPGVASLAATTSDDLIRILSRGGAPAAGAARGDASGSDAELQVAGSVAPQGGGYVIDARILDRRSGLVLWTDRLVRSREEIVAAPGEPAASIAAVLNCALVDRDAANTRVSTEAFGLYLYACAGAFQADDNGQRMLAVTRRLVKAAPRFAGAHAMHAIAAARVAVSTETPDEAAALHAEAKLAAETALKRDPRTAKAYSALVLNEGLLTGRMRQDWAAEARYLKVALSIDPDLAPARNEYAAFLRATGRLRDAIEFTRASSANEDPRYGGDLRTAMMLAAQGDLAAAEEELKRREARDGASVDAVRATIAFWWGDPRIALSNLRALDDPDVRAQSPCLTAYLTALERGRKAHARGLPAGCEAIDPTTRVRLLARQGDVDGAFAVLGDRMPGGPVLLYYPEMAVVRADPRFWRLAERWGLLDYWRASGRWPDVCAAQDCPRAAALALGGARPSIHAGSGAENPAVGQ
jgi:DNA-binding winged helix-turn-helix (wHTH) protein/TolB-like protein/Tfp pilus assembly protein PilF